MSKRFVTYADIVLAEEATSARTSKEIGKWLGKFEGLIDLLLSLNYFFVNDRLAVDDDSADWFFDFAHEKYLEAPYSLHVCNTLMKRGNYLNAMIVLRSLLDYFVSCRYLYHHQQHVIPYRKKQKCLIDGKQKYLGTSHIYGYFSEDFYDRYYGDMLSSLSHGKVGPSLFRIDRSNPIESRVLIVPEFNLKHSFLIINHLIPILYGYLSNREIFFQELLKTLPYDLEKKCQVAITWLEENHRKQAVINPECKDWVEGINKIIGMPCG